MEALEAVVHMRTNSGFSANYVVTDQEFSCLHTTLFSPPQKMASRVFLPLIIQFVIAYIQTRFVPVVGYAMSLCVYAG